LGCSALTYRNISLAAVTIGRALGPTALLVGDAHRFARNTERRFVDCPAPAAICRVARRIHHGLIIAISIRQHHARVDEPRLGRAHSRGTLGVVGPVIRR
jgi:hypothetical protein